MAELSGKSSKLVDLSESERERRLGQRFIRDHDVGPPDECWEWQGTRDNYGYGKMSSRYGRGHSMERAHRVAYEFAYKRHPDKQVVMHMCDNPPCVNPFHLRVGTQRENIQDAARKGRMPGNPNGPPPPPGLKGEDVGTAKLTEDDVKQIRSLYAQRLMSQYELADAFGVSRQNIGYILKRETWRHI